MMMSFTSLITALLCLCRKMVNIIDKPKVGDKFVRNDCNGGGVSTYRSLSIWWIVPIKLYYWLAHTTRLRTNLAKRKKTENILVEWFYLSFCVCGKNQLSRSWHLLSIIFSSLWSLCVASITTIICRKKCNNTAHMHPVWLHSFWPSHTLDSTHITAWWRVSKSLGASLGSQRISFKAGIQMNDFSESRWNTM